MNSLHPLTKKANKHDRDFKQQRFIASHISVDWVSDSSARVAWLALEAAFTWRAGWE